jgi:hypothetical protein
MRLRRLAKALATLMILTIPAIASIEQETAEQSVEQPDKKYPLDDTIEEILNLIDTSLKALDITARAQTPRATTVSSGKIDRRKADQLKQTFSDIRRKLDDLMKLSDDFEERVVRLMEGERKIVGDLADHGVIKFEDGMKRERELIDKESEIQTQHAHNKLQLISNAKGLLLLEPGITATSRTETPSKRPARKRTPPLDDRGSQQEMRELLEAVKVTLQLRKDWVHGISDWRKN